MAEYIDKQELRDKLYDADAITMRGVKILNQFPPADVRPVVRGQWLLEDSASNYVAFKCSVCGAGGRLYKFNFCSSCGADMRGGDAE